MPGLILALGLAAAAPKLTYKPDPAKASDIASVELAVPRNTCFGLVRASVLASSRKSDRGLAYVLSVTVADAPSDPVPHIDGASIGETPLRLLNLRDGDVACTDYQCPTGSAAVFVLAGVDEAAAKGEPARVVVRTNGGPSCDVLTPIEPAVVAALQAWARKLPAPTGH
jgi:hypothetical protein